MNIVIDDNVKETLRIRDKDTITIDYGILSSCWSIMPQVFVKTKDPVDPTEYERHQVDNMTVFIKNDLELSDEVRVRFPKVASDLSGKEFEVEGAIPPMG